MKKLQYFISQEFSNNNSSLCKLIIEKQSKRKDHQPGNWTQKLVFTTVSDHSTHQSNDNSNNRKWNNNYSI